jgi:hypothetical protein
MTINNPNADDLMRKAVQALAQGLGVNESDQYPRFLEAIALSLGYRPHDDSGSIAKSTERIADALERIADSLEVGSPLAN